MGKVIFEIRENIGYIIINRPEKLNALSSGVFYELSEAIEGINKSEEVRVAIITGSGDRAFAVGGDISLLKDLTTRQAVDFAGLVQKMFSKIEQSEKVFIACVNGYALGGGFELALSCDFIYASENAKFGLPETSLAIIPGFGGTQNLPRLVGRNMAKELIFTGKMITAKEAKDLRIVSKIFKSKEKMIKYAEDVAKQIMKNGPIAVGLAKKAIVDGYDLTKEDGLKYEASLFGVVFSTNDAKEGLSAFLEKRKPEYKSK